MYRTRHSCIELLEPRIAPAAVATAAYKDRDGDDVTIKVTTPGGTSAALQTALDLAQNFAMVDSGLQLKALNIFLPIFAGASVSILAKTNPITGGDGLVAVGQIDADGNGLGTVVVDGDLGRIVAGAGVGTTAIKSLTVQSLSLYGIETGDSTFSVLSGTVGKILVKEDVTGATFKVTGGNVGSITIGGSLIGGSTIDTGSIAIFGDVGIIKIGRDIIAGPGDLSGTLFVSGKVTTVTVGGSVLGPTDATDDALGQISIGGKVGKVTIKGDVIGREGDFNAGVGQVDLGGDVGTLTLGGSLLGNALGAISGDRAGTIFVDGVVTKATIVGSIVGGTAVGSGVLSLKTVGTLVIAGDILGGTAPTTGLVVLQTGAASITVNGDIVGRSANAVVGGIDGGPTGVIKKLTVGGNLESRGSGALDGFIRASVIDNLLIKGDIVASTAVGSVAKQIDVGFKLGKLTVGGSLRGNLVNRVEIATPALTSMLVGGNAEFAEISVQDLDTQVASLTVNGAWIKSRFAMAINDGADDIFGTADDPAIANTAVGGIAKIVIKGQVTGTFDGTDSYRIRAPKIGSLSVAGTKYAFGAGAQTFGLGITNDVNATDVV